MTDYLVEFNKIVSKDPWQYTIEENGYFEVVTRENLFKQYVEHRENFKSCETFKGFRGAKTFKEAKKEVVSWLRDWKNEMQMALNEAKSLRKKDCF